MGKFKNIFICNVILSSFLFADTISIPLPASSLAIENTGDKIAINAYQDGVGVYTVQATDSKPIDNSIMNTLVLKYGESAKNAGLTIQDYILKNGTKKGNS